MVSESTLGDDLTKKGVVLLPSSGIYTDNQREGGESISGGLEQD